MQDAAKDVLAQEIIASEVRKFMASSGDKQVEDVSALEETIRQQLTGRTPPCDLHLFARLSLLLNHFSGILSSMLLVLVGPLHMFV
jgi:hypothetical protein